MKHSFALFFFASISMFFFVCLLVCLAGPGYYLVSRARGQSLLPSATISQTCESSLDRLGEKLSVCSSKPRHFRPLAADWHVKLAPSSLSPALPKNRAGGHKGGVR